MKLLLAEDEKELATALTTLLTPEGFQVTCVYNGGDALEHILANSYDVIVLDIMMPILTGLQVLEEARHQSVQTPILLLTAKSETDDIVLGLDRGANDYIVKPFKFKELVARIQAMARDSGKNNGWFSFGNLILNYGESSLQSDTTDITLSQAELGLLEVFFQNPNKQVDSGMLESRVWKGDVEEGQLALYMSYLEKKLAALNADCYFVEEPGGYQLKGHD